MRTIAVPRPDLTDAAPIIRIGGTYIHIPFNANADHNPNR